MPLTLMYITNSPEVALCAERHGVQRIWIDLETLGKEERQKGMDTVKSRHSVSDIRAVRSALSSSEMLVRVNPWNGGSPAEIDAVIEAGAQLVMLPMWSTVEEVRSFVGAVGGRARTVLLLETVGAERCLDEALAVGGVDEVHIGLNDLHLSYGLTFMFELLANGTVDRICGRLAAAGVPYGFGGIARIGEGALPAEMIVMEHYRLGSTRAILSRSFCNCVEIGDVSAVDRAFGEGLAALREFEGRAGRAREEELLANHLLVQERVSEIVASRGERCA